MRRGWILSGVLVSGAWAQEGPGGRLEKGHWQGDGHDHGPPRGHGGHGHPHGEVPEGPSPGRVLGALLPPYIKLHRALFNQSLADVPPAAAALARAAHTHGLQDLAVLAMQLKGDSLSADRATFKSISEGIAVAVLEHPPAAQAFFVFECGQAPGPWVQVGREPKNPFQDGPLRTCGQRVEPPPEEVPPAVVPFLPPGEPAAPSTH